MTPTQKTSPAELAPFALLQGDLPLLPPRSPAAEHSSDEALRELRRFHFSPSVGLRHQPSDPSSPGQDPARAERYLPALLHASRGGGWPAGEYPVLLAPPEAGEQVSCVSLPDLLRRATPEDEGAEPPGRHLEELAVRVRTLAADHRVPVDARRLLEEAGVEAGLEPLLAAVPAGVSLLPESEQAPLHLLMHAARCRLLPAHAALRDEVRALVAVAEALLAADRQKRPESRSSGSVGGSLGELGSRFVDPSALAGVLDERSGGTVLQPKRREGLENALASLEKYLAASASPAPILVHDDEQGIAGCAGLELDGAWRIERHEDPCAAAAEIFDRQADAMARVLRAVRRVRLEAADKYDPERQDPWLERFDWQAFSRQELLLLTPVAALVSAGHAAGPQMASLSGILRSGRPVQILVPVSPSVDPGAEKDAVGFRFEPAYLGLAHREALVQQTSATRPAHMLRGFVRALAATHAGLHVVSTGGQTSDAVALEARAHPLFLYDPESGPSWAERLDFSLNPQPQVDWPVYALETRRPDDSRETLELAFTFADFALLEPAYSLHFHSVSDGVPESELIPAAEYSVLPAGDESTAIPCIWAVDESSKIVRMAISRTLALACRDRLDFWRTLQELSGVRSEYVRRARTQLRHELEDQASGERMALEARHAEELERVRRDAARDVVDRLTAALFEVDPSTFAVVDRLPATLTGLSGDDVDSVAAALLEIVDAASLDDEPTVPAAADGVEKMAADLLRLVEDADS